MTPSFDLHFRFLKAGIYLETGSLKSRMFFSLKIRAAFKQIKKEMAIYNF
jgi:hypothetical protein